MEFRVDQIPAETKWSIATKGLTGALAAHLHLLYNLTGKEKYSEMLRQIWTQIGQASGELAKSLGLAGDDAKSAAEAGAAICICAMGPEYAIEEMVVSPDKTVMKISECPWWNRMKELEISPDLLSACDLAFWDSFLKTLNPGVTMKHGKQMHRGDPYCEWIFATKK
ncbi:MAG: L-2-amino-thiazoline-4-carboxylic acid hydrolase [Syntrophales bacterium]|nr:L-2-amino-thiazoline-4-carboxylic acid hydrolase [Syntrophales bacterium]